MSTGGVEVNHVIEGEKRWRERGLSIDLYDGEIAYMDYAIGEVMETLEAEGLLDETLIIVTSDHGEQLGQHYDNWGHAGLHESVTHVPLVMRCPEKLPKGIRVKGFSQHIDLLPTILDLIGSPVDVPEFLGIDGETLMPLLKGERIRDRIFMEHSSGQRAVRIGEWKLIADEWVKRPRRELELYNVKEDPMEVVNLAETEKEKAEELRGVLHEWVRTNLMGAPDPVVYEDEAELNMRALKYQQKLKRLLELLKN